MVGAIPCVSAGHYIFIKHKNNMHTPVALQKLATGCLVSELLKLKFTAHPLFDGLFKGAN